MKTERTDRRSARTRRLLSEALVALLQEKRYDEITVQDLLDRADVGRSTFYAHYHDKEDLLTGELERVVDVLGSHLGSGAGDWAIGIPSLGLFQHIQEHAKLYRALARGDGAAGIGRVLHRLLSQRVEQELTARAGRPVPELTRVLIAQAVAGTFLTLLRWWMDNGTAVTAEQIDSHFRRLLLPGIRQILAETN